jgi:plastocyanin
MARLSLVAALVGIVAACGSNSSNSKNSMGGPCSSPPNGCSSFTDLTGGTAAIAFGGGLGLEYSPRCAEVKVGQPVTFTGDFSVHPIAQTCGPNESIPNKSSGGSLTVTFASAGTWGYECTVHFGSGMTGAIEVVP